MRSFLDHVPERCHDALRQAIEAVTETKQLLDQVQHRFGTNDPTALRALVGQRHGGVTVTPDAVVELEALHAEHEARRAECRALLDWAARGGTGPAPAIRGIES
ncbi:MAG TPA: hypothetical protein VGC20_13410 [bacterium]|jgi:hypothetical protein